MHSADDILTSLLSLMEKEMQKLTIDIWFSDAKAVELRQDCFIIRTSTSYKKEVIQTRYSEICRKILSQIFSTEMDFIVLDDTEAVPAQKSSNPASEGMKFTFDNFVVGSSNKFAHAAAYAVAMNPAGAYNPLFIYGGSGLGKTHLMKAISNTIHEQHPDYRIIYLKSEDFTNELIDAIKSKCTEEFRSKYRVVDVLLIDDIQFLAGKIQTQEEFFHTFNTLYDAHKQIVLTSDRPPKEIYTLQTRLQTRFEMGLLADIQPPDFETRVAILQKKCELFNINIPENMLSYIANNATANIRQLEGIVNHIHADLDISGGEVDMNMIQRAIKDIQVGSGKKPASELIIEEVCKYYNISPDRLRVKNQSQDIVLPRQVASYILQQLTDMSLQDIGKELGGQHHTTIINSIKKIKNEMRDNPALASAVKDLMSNLSEKEDTQNF
ncbi:MAG: chromosomal replication initiator protein DnaA [Clostridiales bacterium]|nr:chromosomal replication initiator protein DnaA [Clostridiales bacterium]